MKNTRLIQARKAHHWSQGQLAAKLGVHEITVGRWEKGERFPTRCLLFSLFF